MIKTDNVAMPVSTARETPRASSSNSTLFQRSLETAASIHPTHSSENMPAAPVVISGR